MKFLSLIGVELQKIRRSKILLILFLATIITWLPSILHADMSFNAIVSPEEDFFIQGFMAVVWFMFPATMIVNTVLLSQTERTNRGILKMLTLPVRTGTLCAAKFIILLLIAALQMLMTTAMYFISAAIVTQIHNYNFMLSPLFVLKEVGIIYLSSIPMIAVFWMLSVFIQTPIFSIGTGLVSIVPSVLMINTKAWFIYPMCYPFYVITSGYGDGSISISEIETFPWLPVAAAITLFCFIISCLRFGRAERRSI